MYEVMLVDHLDLLREYFQDIDDDRFATYEAEQQLLREAGIPPINDLGLLARCSHHPAPYHDVDQQFGPARQAGALQHYLNDKVPGTWRLISLVTEGETALTRVYRTVWFRGDTTV